MGTIDALLEQGLPQRYIAAVEGVSRQALNQRIYPRGWKERWRESNRIWWEQERKNRQDVLNQFSEQASSLLDRMDYFEQDFPLLDNMDYFEQGINAFASLGIVQKKAAEYMKLTPGTSYKLRQLESLFLAYYDAVEHGEKLSLKELGELTNPHIIYSRVRLVLKAVGLKAMHSRGRRSA